ncbi:cell division protein ZapE [Marinospirillum insulare]|uniref:Cell division protein ZapE n=1 Tax=Marinospirillum insulare TaxID=217169 RepID=A0ABQ5ZZ53_9GAMM|nr:cell division protein ZapE [Marinospirillum insulare]GLR63164.1 cell division protein ZapE [Marinospirillum insulare]
MTPMERYLQDLKREGFKSDPAQKIAVEHLQRLHDDLVQAEQTASSSGLFSRLIKKKTTPAIKGLYFWGGVGRGKTYLVDTFFECLPFEQKMRSHFHRFMQRVHADLKKYDGQANPLKLVAKQLAGEVKVLCLDEFYVKDITDAMILGNLMEALFNEGVVLVTTSNILPDDLYKNGLQRSRFLPAIALLKNYTEVVNVDSGVDYRLRTLTQAEIYHSPLDAAADQSLNKSFDAMARVEGLRNESITINGREIVARRVHDGIAWFEFDELCDGPRSQYDYIELSKVFHTVFLSDVPQLGVAKDDQTRRFINLIDEFYDRSVKVIISAAASIDKIYSGGSLAFEMDRTKSRLLEMQSHEYLAREHKP